MQICRKKYIMDKKIKNIDLKKIKVEILSLRKNLLNLKFQKSTGQLEKTSEIKKIRRKIARLKTDISISKGEINA
tara:strand:- start:621 stop:845 length:225 start_codon:yes stop_codon:yes gene_type:complete